MMKFWYQFVAATHITYLLGLPLQPFVLPCSLDSHTIYVLYVNFTYKIKISTKHILNRLYCQLSSGGNCKSSLQFFSFRFRDIKIKLSKQADSWLSYALQILERSSHNFINLFSCIVFINLATLLHLLSIV